MIGERSDARCCRAACSDRHPWTDSLFCVPGNRDKLGQSVPPSHHLKAFSEYPSSLPFRKEIKTLLRIKVAHHARQLDQGPALVVGVTNCQVEREGLLEQR
jgi:hypothetical protein